MNNRQIHHSHHLHGTIIVFGGSWQKGAVTELCIIRAVRMAPLSPGRGSRWKNRDRKGKNYSKFNSIPYYVQKTLNERKGYKRT